MTHLTAGGADATIAAPMISTASAPSPSDHRRAHHLDRTGLRAGIADRKQRIQSLEQQLVGVCERAAARHTAPSVRIDNRETWDRATWGRYLAAATRLEPDYGPRLRRLYQEIDQLERLAALPLAA